jgi:hypothetical protein
MNMYLLEDKPQMMDWMVSHRGVVSCECPVGSQAQASKVPASPLCTCMHNSRALLTWHQQADMRNRAQVQKGSSPIVKTNFVLS